MAALYLGLMWLAFLIQCSEAKEGQPNWLTSSRSSITMASSLEWVTNGVFPDDRDTVLMIS
jgi:hypothetical protein